MFERQTELMRSSQQFIQAKDSADLENVALKKNLENANAQIEKLREEMQIKNEQIIELKTKEGLVNQMMEKGSLKNDEEIKRLNEENTLLRDKNANLKEEYEQLDEQHKASIAQHEENKNVLESLLSAVKSRMSKKEKDRVSVIEINKYLNSLIQKQDQKNIELENKLDSMTRFRQIVKSSKTIQCKGCGQSYMTSLFSPHVKLCPKLEHNGLNLQVLECNIYTNKTAEAPHYYYKIMVSFAGDTWIENKTFKDLYKFHKALLNLFPNDKFLSEYNFESLSKTDNLSGSQKEELSKNRLEFLKEYTHDISKSYYSSAEYLKLVFEMEICSEESMNRHSSTILYNILKTKPAVLQPQSTNHSLNRSKTGEKGMAQTQKCISFMSMNRTNRKENNIPRYS